MCRMGIFLKAVDKFFLYNYIFLIVLVKSEFASRIFFHSFSYCLASLARSPAGSSVMLRCVRRSEVFTHAAVSTAHSRTAACASLSHTQQSVTTTLHVHARSHAHTFLYFQSLCTLIYFYTDIFFMFSYFFVCLFGINRSLCCTASFTLDEPSEWSGDLQTTKSRNNNIEKVSHPIVSARDY